MRFAKLATIIVAQKSGKAEDRPTLSSLVKPCIQFSSARLSDIPPTIAVARKNYLFADTPSGAAARARLFSIIETAQANGHNPHHYLTVLLAELPNANTVEAIEALLPWHVTPAEVRRRFEEMPKP